MTYDYDLFKADDDRPLCINCARPVDDGICRWCEDKPVAGGPMTKSIWTNESAGVKCWVEARPNERGGMFRILVTTPDKSDPGNGFPYEQEADAVEVAGQTFRAIEAMYNKVETRL
jgi:hypothetical protein